MRSKLLAALLALSLALLAQPSAIGTSRQAEPGSPSASPGSMSTGAAQTITFSIPGATFEAPPQASLFTCAPSDRAPWKTTVELADVSLIDGSTFSASVPAGMAEGSYSLLLGRIGEEYTVHHDLLTVIRPADGRPAAWQATSPIDPSRSDFAAVAAAGQLYLVGGGTSGQFVLQATVSRAPIGSGGALGAWQAEPALITPRAQLAAAATAGYLYAIGGYGGGSSEAFPLASVERAPLRADGSLGPWEETTPLPRPAAQIGAVVAAGQLFVLGTTGHDDLHNGAFAAAINPDGSLGPWRVVDGPPLQATVRPRTLAAASGDTIYVLGGEGGAVFYTRVRADGSLEPWRATAPSLGDHLYGGAVAVGGHLYAVGGFHGCIYGSNLVERAPIQADGSLGPWELAGSTSAGHGFGTAASWGSTIYAIGGMSGFTTWPGTVEYALVEPAGPAPATLSPRLWLPTVVR